MALLGHLQRGDPNRVGPPAGAPGELGPLAASTSLISQYPGAIDVPPVIVDDLTPLSAQWINHVQAIVESIEAEIGPLPRMQRFGNQVNTLQDLLGTSLQPGLSISRSTSAGPAGRVYGIQQIHITQSAATYSALLSGTLPQPFPHHPLGNSKQLFFAMAEAPAGLPVQTIIDGPATVAGRCFSVGATAVLAYDYRGMNGYGGSGHVTNLFEPFGGAAVTAHAILFYMLTDEDT